MIATRTACRVRNGAPLFSWICNLYDVRPEDAIPTRQCTGRANMAWCEFVRQLVERYGLDETAAYLNRADETGRRAVVTWSERGQLRHLERTGWRARRNEMN